MDKPSLIVINEDISKILSPIVFWSIGKKKKRKYYIFQFLTTPNDQKTKGDYLWYIISLIIINDIISKIFLQINLSFITF